MPSSTTIRNAVAQMMGITGASERVASSVSLALCAWVWGEVVEWCGQYEYVLMMDIQVLKKHNYKLDAACDA